MGDCAPTKTEGTEPERRKKMVVIKGVDRGSRAYRAGLEAGDKLLTINGNEINDVLDYRFYLADTRLEIVIDRGDHGV